MTSIQQNIVLGNCVIYVEIDCYVYGEDDVDIDSVTVQEFTSTTHEIDRMDRPDWFKLLDEIAFNHVEQNRDWEFDAIQAHSEYVADVQYDRWKDARMGL